MALVNRTPHPITLRLVDGSDLTLPPAGPAVRCAPTPATLDPGTGTPVPVYRQGALGPVLDLPARDRGLGQAEGTQVGRARRPLGRACPTRPGTPPLVPRRGAVGSSAQVVE